MCGGIYMYAGVCVSRTYVCACLENPKGFSLLSFPALPFAFILTRIRLGQSWSSWFYQKISFALPELSGSGSKYVILILDFEHLMAVLAPHRNPVQHIFLYGWRVENFQYPRFILFAWTTKQSLYLLHCSRREYWISYSYVIFKARETWRCKIIWYNFNYKLKLPYTVSTPNPKCWIHLGFTFLCCITLLDKVNSRPENPWLNFIGSRLNDLRGVVNHKSCFFSKSKACRYKVIQLFTFKTFGIRF